MDIKIRTQNGHTLGACPKRKGHGRRGTSLVKRFHLAHIDSGGDGRRRRKKERKKKRQDPNRSKGIILASYYWQDNPELLDIMSFCL